MQPLTHIQLVERAVRWLSGSKKCTPVLAGIASTEEIPDAIGWNSWGSIVVECKTSIMDFYADKQKYIRWKHPDNDYLYRGPYKEMYMKDYAQVEVEKMGDRRYFLCEPGVLEKSI